MRDQSAGRLVQVLLVAACMRPAITCVGPVLSRIGASTGLSHAWLGLLTALPLLGFAAASPLVHMPSRRFGPERVILWALVLLTAAIAGRSLFGTSGLWIGTAAVGITVAALNVLMPVVVRSQYARQLALVTGMYSAALSVLGALGSGVAQPLARLGGSAGAWRWSLGVWAILTAAVALVWGLRIHGRHGPRTVEPPAPSHTGAPGRSVWRSPAAWRITAYMGLQSTSFYILAAWLPTIVIAHGTSATTAGWYLFVIQLLGVGMGLSVPLLLRRFGRRVTGLLISLPLLVAAVGLELAPSLTPVWVVIFGLNTGPALVLALSLIGFASRDPAHGARLSGMAQCIGYAIAAAGPILAGWSRDLSGTWNVTLELVAALAVAQAGAVCFGRLDGPS